MTDYDALGGEAGLTSVVDAFVRRMASDFVIGWRFEGRDLARIVYHEVEHASGHLGGPRTYSGRPLEVVHGPLHISRGQLRRRLAILRQVLGEHGVPHDVIGRWIAHDEALESSVADPTECGPPKE